MRNISECSAGQIMELGKVYWDKETEDGQLTKFDIAPTPKQCKSLFLPLVVGYALKALLLECFVGSASFKLLGSLCT